MTRTLHLPRPARQQTARVRLLGIGTATPAHLPQADAARLSEPLCCDSAQHAQFLHRIYSHSGITSRSSVLVDADDPTYARSRAFYRPRDTPEDRGPSTADRMQLYQRFAPPLAERSARAAVDAAQLEPAAITHLIPVTCTGFFSPGLDVELINRLGLAPTVQRIQAGFMGCHGAFNALIAARAIAASNPAARVLVTCVELCTLHLAYGFDPQKLVANALFADGSASAVVGADNADSAAAPEICAASTMLIPESLDAMTWRIGNHGFEMTLSPQVPALVRQHVPAWLSRFLAPQGLTPADVPHYAIHPGGPKVLTATADALGFAHERLTSSRQVLAEHGNMSSATVLFVLERLMQQGASGRCLALGYGPGLTAEAMLLSL